MPRQAARVLSNSTPLILLAGIGHLNLLERLYGEVVIPEAVFDEVTAKEDSASSALRGHPAWLRVEHAPKLSTHQRRLVSAKLHVGELEVLALALATGADLVVLDDNAARKTARFLGLTVTGTLGVLLRAKERGMVASVGPLMQRLRSNGFYVDDYVASGVLALAHEA